MPSVPSLDYPFLHRFDHARYRRAYLFGCVDEARVQKDISEALRDLLISPDWVDSGAKALRGKLWGSLMRLLGSMGVTGPRAESMARPVLNSLGGVTAADKGRPDLSGVLAPNGRAWFIEVKAPAHLDPTSGNVLESAGKPSPEQLAFLLEKHRAGAIVGVAWSVEDALEILGIENIKAHKEAARSFPPLPPPAAPAKRAARPKKNITRKLDIF